MTAPPRARKLRLALVLVAATWALAMPSRAIAADDVKKAHETIALYKKTDPGISKFFGKAAGYAVFPGVGKGGIGLGGVAVFTATKQGFMVEASVGGQKFSYEELGAKK